jgi:hypothetical protein
MIPKVISHATDELLLIFQSAGTFMTYEKDANLTDSLRKVLADGITIRILINKVDTVIESKLVKLRREYSNLQINYLDKSIQQGLITTIVVDRELSLIIESRDNDNESNEKIKRVQQSQEGDDNYDYNDLIGFATYSNSHSTVSSYATIFETLWVKSELNL